MSTPVDSYIFDDIIAPVRLRWFQRLFIGIIVFFNSLIGLALLGIFVDLLLMGFGSDSILSQLWTFFAEGDFLLFLFAGVIIFGTIKRSATAWLGAVGIYCFILAAALQSLIRDSNTIETFLFLAGSSLVLSGIIFLLHTNSLRRFYKAGSLRELALKSLMMGITAIALVLICGRLRII